MKLLNEEKGIAPSITTALGFIMQDLSLLEYDKMPQSFKMLIPKNHSLLAYHIWMKRTGHTAHKSYIHS